MEENQKKKTMDVKKMNMFEDILDRISEQGGRKKFLTKSKKAQDIIQDVIGTIPEYFKSIGKELTSDETDTLLKRLSRDIGIK